MKHKHKMRNKRCKICGNNAVEFLRQYKLRLCKDCFINFYEKQVGNMLNKILKKNEKILVCVSGGKDSSAMLAALASIANKPNLKFNFDMEALFIDLEIKKSNYSEKSMKVAKSLCKKFEVKLNVVRLSEYNVSLESFKRKCYYCGIAKRYIMNKFARENDFSCVATGHNLDDILTFFFKNWLSGNFTWSSKFLPRIESFDKMVAKIRPLYLISERESLIYCICKNIPYLIDSCPYVPNDHWKQIIYDIELKKPGFKRSFVINLMNLIKSGAFDLGEFCLENSEYNYCKICGEITTSKSGICAFCKLKNKMERA